MKQQSTIEWGYRLLKASGSDIKTESLLACCMQNGLVAEDFMVASTGFFYREHSKDVLALKLAEDAGRKNYLQIRLTRSSIYDQLPEGLFYQSAGYPAGTGAAEMAAEYGVNKQREQATRQFFEPIDNDFFLQRIELEKWENDMLAGLQSEVLCDYFIRFWNLPENIPLRYLLPLIQLLPHAHRVAGNLDQTAQCLDYILQEKVWLRRVEAFACHVPAERQPMLQEQRLGVDAVMGEQFADDDMLIACSIGPLHHSQVNDYLQGGDKEVFLQTFFRFFMPVHALVETSIEVADKHMVICHGKEPVLGYSSSL